MSKPVKYVIVEISDQGEYVEGGGYTDRQLVLETVARYNRDAETFRIPAIFRACELKEIEA